MIELAADRTGAYHPAMLNVASRSSYAYYAAPITGRGMRHMRA